MKRIAMVTLVCLFAFPAVSFAKGPRGLCGLKMPHGRWWHVPEIAEELNLTIEEQERLDELFVETERKLIDLRSDVHKQELELKVLLDQVDFDATAAVEQFDKVLEARNEVGRERFSFHVAVRELLGLDRYRALQAMFRDGHRRRLPREAAPDGPVREGVAQQ